MIESLSRKKQLTIVLVSVLMVVGIAYVYFALSPSHYSFFLKNHMGQATYEPIWGEAQGIRSDEWGVVTPYFQIAANNDYQRINQDSPYKEDLRFYYGLPLKDWALVFKPYMWGFFILGDARGFSFFHFFMIASFIMGYTIFLMQLRLPLLYSVIIALTLFFSHHNQVWWSTNAPVFALTIWIIIPFLTNWTLAQKFIATFLISVAALLALIYPPWQISVIYLVGIFALVFRPERFRIGNLLVCFFGFALAAALSLYYLVDIIPLVQNTVYPGDRSFSGGSGSLYYLWTLVFPHSLITPSYKPIVSGSNMPEIGTVSSLLFLCLLAFGSYKAFFQTIKNNIAKTVILVSFAGALFAWIYLPIPSTIGQFLLLDQIESKRLLLANGTFVVWLVAILALKTPWVISWVRVLLYGILVLVGGYFYKESMGSMKVIDNLDLLVLAPIGIVCLWKVAQSVQQRRIQKTIVQNSSMIPTQELPKSKQNYMAYIFATIALGYNFIAFAGFNPVQSSYDIFSASKDSRIAALKAFAEDSNIKGLAIDRHTAASASGLSLSTYNHVLVTPKLDVFQEEFPDLDEIKFNTVFNRYAHFVFNSEIDEPVLVQADYIELPMDMLSETVPVINSPVVDDTTQIYGVKYLWQKPNLLNVKFRSPVPVKLSELSVIAGDLLPSAVTIKPLLLFTDYFSSAILSPSDAILWELNLEFPEINTTETSYYDLEAIYIDIADKSYKLLLEESRPVTSYDAQEEQVYPVSGIIDVATYNTENATLTLTGWAPIEGLAGMKLSEQMPRWFGYDSDLDIQFQTLQTIPRPDVANIYGDAQRLSGFSMIFDVKTPPARLDFLELCLYSRTKDTGIYQLNGDPNKLPIVCTKP